MTASGQSLWNRCLLIFGLNMLSTTAVPGSSLLDVRRQPPSTGSTAESSSFDFVDAEFPVDSVVDEGVKLAVTLLGFPRPGSALGKEFLDFFNCLATGFRIAMTYVSFGLALVPDLGITHVKKNWMAAPKQSVPKTMNSFQVMLRKAGGMKRPIAKLKSQLPTAAIP